MKKIFVIGAYLSLLLTCVACATQVTIKIRVIDDQSNPVDNVNVSMAFLLGKGINNRSGVTDSDGVLEITENADFGVKIYAVKDGYYASSIRTGYGDRDVTLMLRKKINPIALYAKKFSGFIPKSDEKIGFDFEVGDWAFPNGKGIKTDVYFEYHGDVQDFWNYKEALTISFPFPSDGIQDITDEEVKPYYHISKLRLPYNSPNSGYKNEKICRSESIGAGKPAIFDCDAYNKIIPGYFMRVRSETDGNGAIIRANYVKLAGSIMYSGGYKHVDDKRLLGDNAASISFTYYYNPKSNDHNTEFDLQNNLFKNLKQDERVIEP
jgi:hypothetical protein